MGRLANGDRTAIDPVYRALWPLVVRYCSKMVGDSDAAEDLAQRSLLKLFEQAHDYDRGKRPETWALTIAAWECRTYRQRRARDAKNVANVARVRQAQDSSPDVERDVWQRQAMEALDQLLGEIPVEDRRALVDSFVRGLSEPLHRKRKQRVLARLRRRWKELYETP